MAKSLGSIHRFKCKRGQGLVEYLIIVALMAVASIGIVRLLGHTVQAKVASIIYSLQGKTKRPQIESPREVHYKKKDLGNFMNGSASKSNGFE